MPRCPDVARFCWTCGGNADHPDHALRCAVIQAYHVGLRRSRRCRQQGRTHRHRWTPTPRHQRHTDGMSAVAEWFVAETLHRRWLSAESEGPDDPDAGDVEGGIQVRWTPLGHGSLIVHDDDKDHLVGALVVNPQWPLRIAGWFPIHLAKRACWWRDDVREPAYFVPQELLHGIDGLAARGVD
jgi:hypothetical protein